MIEYRVGYYLRWDKYVAQRRRVNLFSVGEWKSLGEWTKTKAEAEALIERAKKMEEEEGVTVIDA